MRQNPYLGLNLLRERFKTIFKRYAISLKYVDKGVMVDHESEIEAPDHIDAIAWTLHKVKWDGNGYLKEVAILRID